MQHLRCVSRVAVCLMALSLIGVSAPALGHAALVSSDPKDGATLGIVPITVKVSYAEPPTTDAKFSVTDGCDRDVARKVKVLNQEITADVSSGQPGDWTVEWSVVSAVDGHLTKDSIGFSVRGEPDCEQAAADDDPADEGSASSFPIVPVGVATVVILAVAVLIRLRSRTD